jgi:hypothetical protein
MPGFPTHEVTGIVLQGGDSRTVRTIALELATVAETVSVSVALTPLNSGEKAATLTGEEIRTMPVVGIEIVRREDLSLDDGEVDLDLVAGVDRRVHHDQIGPLAGEALLAALAAVGAAVVDHPEHSGGGAVGFPRHHLANQPAEGSDAGLALTAARRRGPDGRPRRPESTHWAAGSWRGAAVSALAGLNAGLLVGTDDELVPLQWPPLPDAFVEVEDSARLVGEEWIPGEDPAAMGPRRIASSESQRQMVDSPIEATSRGGSPLV